MPPHNHSIVGALPEQVAVTELLLRYYVKYPRSESLVVVDKRSTSLQWLLVEALKRISLTGYSSQADVVMMSLPFRVEAASLAAVYVRRRVLSGLVVAQVVVADKLVGL